MSMAAEAENGRQESHSDKTAGLVCRKCGCRHFEVAATRRGSDVIVRYRVCRHCGARRTTVEN